jgi:hypothetical protein
MKALRARVANGRIEGDAPPGLPEGEVDLCLAEPDDEMDPEELAALNRKLESAWRSIEAGHFRPASEIIGELLSGR